MTDFLSLAADRYSVRSFLPAHLPQEMIEKLLQAAHLAPTGCNNQPQRILLLNTDEAIERLKPCTKCHFNAPTAMLVCYNREECWVRKYDGADCGVVDATIVATHILLEAADLGVGATCVMHFDPVAMRNAFSIPDHVEPVVLLVMGYPAPDAVPLPLHSQYRPLDEVLVMGSF